jgi:hypothetical protein
LRLTFIPLVIGISLQALCIIFTAASFAAPDSDSFGPPRDFRYGLEGLMDPEEIPEHRRGHVKAFSLAWGEVPKDPTVLILNEGTLRQLVERTYKKNFLEDIELRDLHVPDFDFVTDLPHLKWISIVAEPPNLNQTLLNALATDKSLRHVLIRGDISRLDLSVLKDLPKLSRLHLMDSHLTAENISQLARIKALRSLELENPELPADQFCKLSQLKSVRELQMAGFSVAGDNLSFLRELPNLHRLHLRVTTDSSAMDQVTAARNLEVFSCVRMTDADLAKLGSLTRLWAIEILGGRGTSVTGETLFTLHNLPLRYLSLQQCRLSEQGLRQLTDMKTLEGLDLTWTAISDADILRLSALTSLRTLRLDCVKYVTPAGVEKLCELLPDCSIHFGRNCTEY